MTARLGEKKQVARLMIVWDYDSAIGHVNATYPYNFHEENLLREIENVEQILSLARENDIRMTFACVGFAAEPGNFPYHVGEQIARIFADGHEIASHSWKHEWFPYLQKEQIRRSLARSKLSLETCIGRPGSVVGFVPPFNRPMTWYRKGAISVGDRVFGPWYPGGNLGSLLRLVAEAGYRWCRVSFRSLWKKLLGRQNEPKLLASPPKRVRQVACISDSYSGFDRPAQQLLRNAAEESGSLVVSGHPSSLSRQHGESLEHLRAFLRAVVDYRSSGLLLTSTVAEYLETCGGQNR